MTNGRFSRAAPQAGGRGRRDCVPLPSIRPPVPSARTWQRPELLHFASHAGTIRDCIHRDAAGGGLQAPPRAAPAARRPPQRLPQREAGQPAAATRGGGGRSCGHASFCRGGWLHGPQLDDHAAWCVAYLRAPPAGGRRRWGRAGGFGADHRRRRHRAARRRQAEEERRRQQQQRRGWPAGPAAPRRTHGRAGGCPGGGRALAGLCAWGTPAPRASAGSSAHASFTEIYVVASKACCGGVGEREPVARSHTARSEAFASFGVHNWRIGRAVVAGACRAGAFQQRAHLAASSAAGGRRGREALCLQASTSLHS